MHNVTKNIDFSTDSYKEVITFVFSFVVILANL